MRKVMLLAVLAVAFMAMPALASVQNVKISGDIETTYLHRQQFDLGDVDIDQQQEQNVILTQTRLRVDADLTDNVATTVGLINERAWDEDLEDGAGSSDGNNDVDLNLAYVTLREMLYSPLTVIVGRQSFAFGNSFVVDSAGTNNTVSAGGLRGVAEDLSKRRAMDAVRLIFDYNPLTIDVIGAKVDANTLAGSVVRDDDVELFGTNANYKLGDQWETVVEAYFWSKIDQSTKIAGLVADPGKKADTIYMPGIHVSTSPTKRWNVQAEVAWQLGNKATTFIGRDNMHRNALGAQVINVFHIPWEPFATMHQYVVAVYTYLSGDSGPAEAGTDTGDDHYTMWDPFFENQSAPMIYNVLFDSIDSHTAFLRTQAWFAEDLSVQLEYMGIWLDKVFDDSSGGCGPAVTCFSLRQGDGTTTTPRMTNNFHVGDEVGFTVFYDYTEDVQIAARANWFYPGNAFHSNNDKTATQYLLNALVNF